MIHRLIVVLFLVVVCVTATGCAMVRPYERAIHARRCMQMNPDPVATSVEQHVFDYREGASGGYEALGGSGCGCN